MPMWTRIPAPSTSPVPANDDLDSWNGQYSGQGFPAVKTGGLHYNNKWDNDFQSTNGNYKYLDLSVNGTNTTNSEYILPDTLYYNNQTQQFKNQIIRHSFSGAYELKFDSTSSLKLLADGGTDHKITSELDNSSALASDSSTVNQNTRTISTVGDTRIVNSDLLWKKKLSRQGRTFSFNLRQNYSNNTSSGYLYSNTQFYSGGLPTQDSLIDQYKSYHTENVLLDAKMTYTEPLGKGNYLAADYGVTVSTTAIRTGTPIINPPMANTATWTRCTAMTTNTMFFPKKADCRTTWSKRNFISARGMISALPALTSVTCRRTPPNGGPLPTGIPMLPSGTISAPSND